MYQSYRHIIYRSPVFAWGICITVQEEWRKNSMETLHHLILSLPNHVKAIIKAKEHIKY